MSDDVLIPSLPHSVMMPKFYNEVDVIQTSNSDQVSKSFNSTLDFSGMLSSEGSVYSILLDGHTVAHSLFKDPMLFKSLPLALGICEEWNSQPKWMEFEKMPLTKLFSFATRLALDLNL